MDEVTWSSSHQISFQPPPRQDQNPCLIACQLLWPCLSSVIGRRYHCCRLLVRQWSKFSFYLPLCCPLLAALSELAGGHVAAASCGATLHLNVDFKFGKMLEDDWQSQDRWTSAGLLFRKSVGNSGVKDSVEELQIWRLRSYFQRKPRRDPWSDVTRGPLKRLLNVGDF